MFAVSHQLPPVVENNGGWVKQAIEGVYSITNYYGDMYICMYMYVYIYIYLMEVYIYIYPYIN